MAKALVLKSAEIAGVTLPEIPGISVAQLDDEM
jgi:hypothetical protein